MTTRSIAGQLETLRKLDEVPLAQIHESKQTTASGHSKYGKSLKVSTAARLKTEDQVTVDEG